MRAMIEIAGRVRTGIGILLVTTLALAVPLTALAHAKLVRSTPAQGEVQQSPSQVELWFNELLDVQFNSIVVFPASELNAKSHANLAKGAPQVDPQDQTHLTVALKPLPPGSYMVEWRVLSRDGHSAPGRFQFKVLGSR